MESVAGQKFFTKSKNEIAEGNITSDSKACTPIAAGLEVTPPVTMKAIAFPGAIPFFDQAGY